MARMKKVSNDANTITHVERAVLHGINFSMNIKNKTKIWKDLKHFVFLCDWETNENLFDFGKPAI